MSHLVAPGVEETIVFFKRLCHWFRHELNDAHVCLKFLATSNRKTALERALSFRQCTGMLAKAYQLPIIAMCNIDIYDGMSIPLDQLMERLSRVSFVNHAANRMQIQRAAPRILPLPKTLEEEHSLYDGIVGAHWLTQTIPPSSAFECDSWVVDSSDDSDITVLPDGDARMQYLSINPRIHFDNVFVSPPTLRNFIRRWGDEIGCRLECSAKKVQRALQVAWHSAVDKTLRERVWTIVKTIDGPCLVVGLRDSCYHRVLGNDCWQVREALDYI